MRMTVTVFNDPNLNHRERDEDRTINKQMANGIWIVGIFDGHGGSGVSHHLSKNIDSIFGNLPRNLHAYTIPIIKRKFKQIDSVYKNGYYTTQGSTASLVLFDPMNQNSFLSINLGDSRTITFNMYGKDIYTTHDHKPNTPYETQRIIKMGGSITREKSNNKLIHRVNGNLSVSRSFGDWYMGHNPRTQNKIISNMPTIHKVPLKNVKYITVVCDGVTDVLSNKQIGKIVSRGGTAKDIVRIAKQRGSTDNISAILIKVN